MLPGAGTGNPFSGTRMTRGKQLQHIDLNQVLEKRRLDQARDVKECAVLAGISYSAARSWFRLPGSTSSALRAGSRAVLVASLTSSSDRWTNLYWRPLHLHDHALEPSMRRRKQRACCARRHTQRRDAIRQGGIEVQNLKFTALLLHRLVSA